MTFHRPCFALLLSQLLLCISPAFAEPSTTTAPHTGDDKAQHRTFSGFAAPGSSAPSMSAPRLSPEDENAMIMPKNPQAAAEHHKQVTIPSYPWSGPALVQPFKFPKSVYDHLRRHDPDITQRLQPSDFLPPQRRTVLVGRSPSFAPQSFNFLQYAQSLKH